jgi:recombination protein RecA
MATARAALESLLRSRKLDVTLTTARPWAAEREDQVAATGIPDLDGPLGGGLRRGQVSEIVGPRSSGRTSILNGVLAAATGRGEVMAVIDTSDRFDPAAAEARGVDLSRLLWIRERGDAARALKALNLVLQAGGFGVVAFDLADVPAMAIRQFPYTTWMRIARVIEGGQTALVLLGSDRIARSPGGATVTLTTPSGSRYARWHAGGDRSRFLAALATHPRVVSANHQSPIQSPIESPLLNRQCDRQSPIQSPLLNRQCDRQSPIGNRQ